MADETRRLVEQLTNIVTTAKGALEQHCATSTQVNTISNVDGNETLRTLYPSTAANNRNRKDIYTPSSTTTATSSLWGGRGRGKRKANSFAVRKSIKKGKKVAETLKEVFLVYDPNIDTVPRKSERQFYYRNKLVASAIKFNADMNETDVRLEILTHFDQQKIHDFEFLKAIGDKFIVPQVDNWDYATMRHVCGQGPLYIRSKKKLKMILCGRNTMKREMKRKILIWKRKSKISNICVLSQN